MDKDSAMAILGTDRIHPVTLSVRFKRPIPGTGGTIHKCIRLEGKAILKDGVESTDYSMAWITGYSPGQEMWLGVDQFAEWPLADQNKGKADQS